MATNDSVKNELTKPSKKKLTPEQQLNHTLTLMGPEIQRALPKHMNADRIARIALTAVRNTPKLLQTDQKSFLAALMQASQLGLEPNTPLGQAYLIPYGNQTQFQLGYQGLLDLAYRTGEYQVIYAKEVYINDEFEYEYGLNPDLKHVPAMEPDGDPVGYYAVYRLKNGGYSFEYWPKQKVLLHAKKFSKSFSNGPWKTNFDEMAKKTVIKSLLKYAPKSIEFAEAVSNDETIKTFDQESKEVIDVTDSYQENQNLLEESSKEPQTDLFDSSNPPLKEEK
ncbi:recombinase RecT [Enterococcus dispar]